MLIQFDYFGAFSGVLRATGYQERSMMPEAPLTLLHGELQGDCQCRLIR